MCLIASGIVPLKEFSSSQRTTKLVSSPIRVDIVPDNLFEARNKFCNSVALYSSSGIVPVILFPFKSRAARLFNVPISVGKLPEKSFSYNYAVSLFYFIKMKKVEPFCEIVR